MMKKNKVRRWVGAGLILLCLGGFLSLSRTKPERVQPAQNTKAVPPGAVVATTAGSAPVSASPADGTSKAAPGEVPLQVGRHAANAEFRYQFLGSVKAYMQPQILRLHTSDGTVAEFPVKVFYTESGNFIRAEFVKPGAGDFQSSAEDLEVAHRQVSEPVTGLPQKPLPMSLESLFERLNMRLEDATRFNVTYVMYKTYEEQPAPMLLFYVFGLRGGPLSARFGDEEERFRRTRIVMDPDGKVRWEDNML